ncbi:zinc-binding dehydrogenase [Amycolatopsis sp. NBC_01286]|uniref:zinc-binding dehydrogenase n=1 Tax=Amycolatopsis sp. NBC_01286 TaxID=2903560 RepID=UPI002E139356|nr:zinc-binding dehydrogenase [Amycolatopsis sp. NBC_01286]
MEAIMATRFGGPEVLAPVTLPTPEPPEGHVRVDVASPAWAGWTHSSGAATPRRGLPEALAVLDDGSTALALLEKTPVAAGDDVLVLPGLGGLGSLLVQLPRDAVMIAAVRGPEKVKLAHDLGVRAVDYGSPDWTSKVPGVDVVFDGVGGPLGATALSLLRDGGRFSGYGMSSGAPTTVPLADHRRLASVADMSQLPEFWPETPRRVRQALTEAAAGRLIPLIGRTYPLAEAAAAHTDFEKRRAVGKILLHP